MFFILSTSRNYVAICLKFKLCIRHTRHRSAKPTLLHPSIWITDQLRTWESQTLFPEEKTHTHISQMILAGFMDTLQPGHEQLALDLQALGRQNWTVFCFIPCTQQRTCSTQRQNQYLSGETEWTSGCSKLMQWVKLGYQTQTAWFLDNSCAETWGSYFTSLSLSLASGKWWHYLLGDCKDQTS